MGFPLRLKDFRLEPPAVDRVLMGSNYAPRRSALIDPSPLRVLDLLSADLAGDVAPAPTDRSA
jgi:hypothetical protein